MLASNAVWGREEAECKVWPNIVRLKDIAALQWVILSLSLSLSNSLSLCSFFPLLGTLIALSLYLSLFLSVRFYFSLSLFPLSPLHPHLS
jgi:hypothetical protein